MVAREGAGGRFEVYEGCACTLEVLQSRRILLHPVRTNVPYRAGLSLPAVMYGFACATWSQHMFRSDISRQLLPYLAGIRCQKSSGAGRASLL
jgi:hypothetical protein